MKTKKMTNQIFAWILVFVVTVTCLPLAKIYSVKAANISDFVNDARWSNGINWGDGQGPKLSGWRSSGCCAYVCDFVKFVYGHNSYKAGATTFTNVNEIREGDVIHTGNHYFAVLGRNGNKLYTAEGNMGGKVCISNTRYSISGSVISYRSASGPATYKIATGYHHVSQVSVDHVPDSTLESIISENGHVRVTGWSFDRDCFSSPVAIHVYMDEVFIGGGVADKKRTDVNTVHGCGEYHGFEFTIPIKSAGTHTFKVFAINIGKDGKVNGQGNPLVGSKTLSITLDETPPVISDVKIIEQDSSGYTIECKATDNKGIDRVQCPTWTVANGQDDIQSEWWTNSYVRATDKGNGIYQFRVNIADHNYEYGQYVTHIYAYDKSGNYTLEIVDNVEVFENRLQFYEGYGRGLCTMDGRDARVIGFDVVAREGDEGSILTITTMTTVDGKDITKHDNYTINRIGRNTFYHLVDRSKYNYGDGDYTTMAVLKNKNGEILESEKTVFRFAKYAGPYYISLNVGEEVDVYKVTGTADNKNGLKFKNWLWPDNCNICTGKIECIGDDICKGKKEGRVYASFINISSAERTTIIIDVGVPKVPDSAPTIHPAEPLPPVQEPNISTPTPETTNTPAVPPSEVPWSNPFQDVVAGKWYYDAIQYVNQNGLMSGYQNGKFGTTDKLLRAQFAQILYNKEGKPATGIPKFSDVPAGKWYSDAVAWAADKGIVSGYANGKFGPNDIITREQYAVMLWRYAGSPEAVNRQLYFRDAYKVGSWAKEALYWAVEKGLISGKEGGTILDPKGCTTRAEAAAILMRYLK